MEPSNLDSLSTRHQSAIPEPVSNEGLMLENIEEDEFIDYEEADDDDLMEEDDLSYDFVLNFRWLRLQELEAAEAGMTT